MKPYLVTDAESDLRAALDLGAWEQIAHYVAEVDRLDQPHNPVALLAAACWYAEQNLRVFPLRRGMKVPHPRTHGVLDATTDPTVLHAWWSRWPDSNIGIATGFTFDCIDFDGVLGHQSWAARYGTSGGGVTVLATVTTPRPGGLHVWTPAQGHGNRAGLLPGIDYRGRGGYVVAPPSRTPAGDYRFLRPFDPDHTQGEPA